jgi:hypothetical protein
MNKPYCAAAADMAQCNKQRRHTPTNTPSTRPKAKCATSHPVLVLIRLHEREPVANRKKTVSPNNPSQSLCLMNVWLVSKLTPLLCGGSQITSSWYRHRESKGKWSKRRNCEQDAPMCSTNLAAALASFMSTSLNDRNTINKTASGSRKVESSNS